ncbi:MAG: aspartate ammonia-lyase [Candidatus Endobugula sp.]|jgi:aspartate ammonia-lyase
MLSNAVDASTEVRIEKDLLGEAGIPKQALYGIQTWRATQNFNLTGVPLNHFPEFVRALAMVKMAAAKANAELGNLSQEKADVIIRACEDIINDQYHDAFIVDMIQGGAGTSTNMNANEVITNIALQYMGEPLGNYKALHPNNDVNLSQSTNDAYPTAVRLGILLSHGELVDALKSLKSAFSRKAEEFKDVIKMGRTQLQDAVPMTLGQEFASWATNLEEDVLLISSLSDKMLELNLGGTAIGTGINADPRYGKKAIAELAKLSGFNFVQAKDLIEASSDMGAFVLFSSLLKRLAIKLSKISNDLRLLSMGPRAGLNEINLPAQQPGSSIMPGKINPVIPEAMSQVAYQVMGSDVTIGMAAEAGQLQLNAMEPLITYNTLESIRLMTRAMTMLETRCIDGITANAEHCRSMVENSIGIITALNPFIGYENSSRIAKQALAENRSIVELVESEGLLKRDQLDVILDPKNMFVKQI